MMRSYGAEQLTNTQKDSTSIHKPKRRLTEGVPERLRVRLKKKRGSFMYLNSALKLARVHGGCGVVDSMYLVFKQGTAYKKRRPKAKVVL